MLILLNLSLKFEAQSQWNDYLYWHLSHWRGNFQPNNQTQLTIRAIFYSWIPAQCKQSTKTQIYPCKLRHLKHGILAKTGKQKRKRKKVRKKVRNTEKLCIIKTLKYRFVSNFLLANIVKCVLYCHCEHICSVAFFFESSFSAFPTQNERSKFTNKFDTCI